MEKRALLFGDEEFLGFLSTFLGDICG